MVAILPSTLQPPLSINYTAQIDQLFCQSTQSTTTAAVAVLESAPHPPQGKPTGLEA